MIESSFLGELFFLLVLCSTEDRSFMFRWMFLYFCAKSRLILVNIHLQWDSLHMTGKIIVIHVLLFFTYFNNTLLQSKKKKKKNTIPIIFHQNFHQTCHFSLAIVSYTLFIYITLTFNFLLFCVLFSSVCLPVSPLSRQWTDTSFWKGIDAGL